MNIQEAINAIGMELGKFRERAETAERELAEARRHLQELVDAYEWDDEERIATASAHAHIYLKGGL